MNPSALKTKIEEFDPEKYAHHVAAMNLTPEQQQELIQLVANIMLSYVAYGFGVSPGQTPCGQDDILGDLIPKTAPDLVECDPSETETQNALEALLARADQEES